MIQPLCCGGLESTYSLYPSLSKLLSLLELEEASTSVLVSPQSSQDAGLGFLDDWAVRLPHLDCDYQFVEPVLAQRHSILHCLLQAAGREGKGRSDVWTRRRVEGLFGAIRDNLLTQAQLAREAGRYQVSQQNQESVTRASIIYIQLSIHCITYNHVLCTFSVIGACLKLFRLPREGCST